MNYEQKYKALLLVATGEKYDAMDLSRAYYKAYKETLDWHLCSDLLDELQRRGIVQHDGWGYHRNHCYRLQTS